MESTMNSTVCQREPGEYVTPSVKKNNLKIKQKQDPETWQYQHIHQGLTENEQVDSFGPSQSPYLGSFPKWKLGLG